MAVQKLYQYKIYSPQGVYLGMLPQSKVMSDFNYNQLLATTFVQTEVLLAQPEPDTLTVNDNLIKIYEVSTYYPSGKKVFDGYISKWRVNTGGDKMLLTCISHGQDASQYIMEAGDAAYISQLTENSTSWNVGYADAFGQDFKAQLQTFTVAVNKNIGAVDIMVSTQEAADVYVYIKQKVGSNPDTATDPTVMSGHISLASGLVKSVQHITFNSPSTLTTGNTYYIVVYWFNAGVNTMQIWGSSANPYANGTVWLQSFTGGTSWQAATQVSGSDLYFVIYQHGGATISTYTSKDPTYMLADLLSSYNDRGGLIQQPANPITPIYSLPFIDGSMSNGSWGSAYAQTFTPTSNIQMNIVQLYLGVSSGSQSVQVRLYRGNPSLDTVSVIGGTQSYDKHASNTLLATSDSVNVTNASPNIKGFQFSTPISLTSGVQYYVVVDFGFGGFGTLLFKGATNADTVSAPFGQMYYGLVSSNNTTVGMTFNSALPAFYLNIGYEATIPAVISAGYEASGVTTSYTFQQQTFLRALEVIGSLLPFTWYWYVDPEDNTLYVREASTTADITLIKGRHIGDLEIEATKETIVNSVYFTGGDDGTGTSTNVSVKKTADVGDNRVGLAQISDNRVSGTGGAAVGAIIAQDYLDRYDSETYQTTVTVLETTMDINLLSLGMMVGFRGYAAWVEALVLQIVGIERHPDFVVLTLGTLPVRTSKAVADIDAGLAYIETVNNPSVPS